MRLNWFTRYVFWFIVWFAYIYMILIDNMSMSDDFLSCLVRQLVQKNFHTKQLVRFK